MRHLRTIEGAGRLSAGGEDLGEVQFRLEIIEDQGMLSGSGVIAAAPEALMAAFDAHGCEVVRADTGAAMRLTVTRYSVGGDVAEVLLNGPPGD